jgi:hypothetical protein
MTSDGQSVDRMREYLRTLTPEARAMLVMELERGLLSGEESAGNDFVLQELRRAIRAEAQKVPRIGDAARMFFVPLEPFLVNGSSDHKRTGRIARASLEPIWQWIGRDLMPAETKALADDINRALHANDRTKAEQLVGALHQRAIQRMKDALAALGTDDKAQRRFGIQVGTSRAFEDVSTILCVLEIRDVLADLARRLPPYVRVFERTEIEVVKMHLDSAAATKSLEGTAARKADVLLYGLVLAMNRLTVPWQLIRVAVRAAGSDEPARIAETLYAVAVTIVLSDLENMVGELRTEFKAGRPITSLLKELHVATRGLRSELDLSVESGWSRQLAAIRSEVSNLLKPGIEVTPACVRRVLRPRPTKEIAPKSVLDAADVDEAATRIEFLIACRNYAGELALSEVTMRAYSDLTQYLETGTTLLLDALRHAGISDQPFRQSQVEAAIRLCRTVFGNDYAGMLAKAADMAVQAAAIERKSMRA